MVKRVKEKKPGNKVPGKLNLGEKTPKFKKRPNISPSPKRGRKFTGLPLREKAGKKLWGTL